MEICSTQPLFLTIFCMNTLPQFRYIVTQLVYNYFRRHLINFHSLTIKNVLSKERALLILE